MSLSLSSPSSSTPGAFQRKEFLSGLGVAGAGDAEASALTVAVVTLDELVVETA